NDYRVQYMFLIIKLLKFNEVNQSDQLSSTELMQLFMLGHDDEIVLINLFIAIRSTVLKEKLKILILRDKKINDFLKKYYLGYWQ
ncbi:MAG TPA: hypothetical protein PLZ62_02755, partial [bacterium]|nr:hypothetical protein [bacterium]